MVPLFYKCQNRLEIIHVFVFYQHDRRISTVKLLSWSDQKTTLQLLHIEMYDQKKHFISTHTFTYISINT